jgi:hypothetical protein
MAERLKGNGAAKKPAKDKTTKTKTAASRKSVTAGAASLGHNLKKLREEGVPFMQRLFALQEQMEADAGGYRVDFKNLYDEASKGLGIKAAIIKEEFRRMLRRKKEEAKERELAEAERDQIEAFRAAFDGTEFGAWAAGELAKGAAPEQKKPGSDEEQAERENAEAGA